MPESLLMIAIIWAVVLSSCGEMCTPPGSVKSIAIAEPSVMGHAQVTTVLRSAMVGWKHLVKCLVVYHGYGYGITFTIYVYYCTKYLQVWVW